MIISRPNFYVEQRKIKGYSVTENGFPNCRIPSTTSNGACGTDRHRVDSSVADDCSDFLAIACRSALPDATATGDGRSLGASTDCSAAACTVVSRRAAARTQTGTIADNRSGPYPDPSQACCPAYTNDGQAEENDLRPDCQEKALARVRQRHSGTRLRPSGRSQIDQDRGKQAD